MKHKLQLIISSIFLIWAHYSVAQSTWNSEWLTLDENEKLVYFPDEQGNTIPDFSRVGYLEGKVPPYIETSLELEPQAGDNRARIQSAIDKLSAMQPNANGIRGVLLLKKGTYEVSDQINIGTSGIIIRGEGNTAEGTVLIATGKKQYSLFQIQGQGSISEIAASRVDITMPFVPVGTKKLAVKRSYTFQTGDKIIVYRPGTSQWISDIQMDKIEERNDGEPVRQWLPNDYGLHFERKVEQIVGDTLIIDYPIVMAMEEKYGGGSVYKYQFEGRINQCGIENLLLKSDYADEFDENHAWDAVKIDKARDCWVRGVVAKHFGYSAVNIASSSRNISVLDCQCLEGKSIITGGRRYSFNCNGQLNLFKNCETTEGRHDFVTGARVCGPNVFTQCRASNAHNDIGPHHRWATGTLYDQIESDGVINVQDRGNYGTGHGWAGANQILWNCTASEICVQSPWASAKNYAIGCFGTKSSGRLADRPDGEWEGINQSGLLPASLYEAQRNDKKEMTTFVETKRKDEKLFSAVHKNNTLSLIFMNRHNGLNIEIFTINGSPVANYSVSNNISTMQVPFQGNGIFLIRMTSGQQVQTQKIML